MAAPRFINLIAGKLTQVIALISSSGAGDGEKIVATDTTGQLHATVMPGGAPVATSAGAGDAGKLPKLDAGGKLDATMMPSGLGADQLSIQASENLTAGDIVNLWSNAGSLRVRKADATTAGKEAHGFVQSAITSGASGVVTFDGSISGLSGLTVGPVYLSTTPGGVTGTVPSTAGNVVQQVGYATSATTLVFEMGTPVTLA